MAEPSRPRGDPLATERLRAAVALAIATGVLITLAGPPLSLPAAMVAALACLLSVSCLARSPGQAAALGLLAGFVANCGLFYWVVGLLENFAGFATPLAVLVACLLYLAQGGVLAAVTWASRALIDAGCQPWLVLPPVVVVVFGGSPPLFPWRPSEAFLPWLPWVQLAELGGRPLLDLLITLGTAGLCWGAKERAWRPAAVGAAACLLLWGYGAARLPQIEERRLNAAVARVGVVQPNASIEDKRDPEKRSSNLALLQQLTEQGEARGAELTIWPETSHPHSLRRSWRRDLPPPYGARGQRIHRPLIIGAVTVASDRTRYNSAVAIDERGRITGISDKVELLAFGEYVPLWDYLPPLRERFRSRGLTAGRAPETLTVAGYRIGVLNCYEDVLAEHARTVALDGPDLLVNVTNDAWFGDTTEPYVHHQVARMRAIETRRDLVRAVNTGVSGHIAATGAEVVRTPTWRPAVFIAEVRVLSGVTPWVRLGDLTTPAAAGALLGVAGARFRRRSRSAQ